MIRQFAVAAAFALVMSPGAFASDGTSLRVAPTVDVQEPVNGQLVAAAGTVRIEARVAGDALIASGRTNIAGTVEGNVLAATGAFTLSPQGQIGGDLRVAAGDAEISGAVGGDVVVATGSVTIDGHVGGDVRAISGKVIILPGAVIGGTIRGRGAGWVEVSPDARILGGESSDAMPPPKRESRVVSHTFISGALLFALFHFLNFLFVILFLIEVLFLALFPGFVERTAATLRARTGAALVAGFLVAMAIPVAIVVLMATLIGAPVALLALPAYVLLLALAYGMGALTFAAAIWRRLRVGEGALSLPSGFLARAACLFVGLVLISFLWHLPLIGGIVPLMTILLGLGALAMEIWRRWRT